MFKVPAGAKVWALDATPVLELKDGSVVFAAKPEIPVPPETFAKAEAKAICSYFGIAWVEPKTSLQVVNELVSDMLSLGAITGAEYWTNVLLGSVPVNVEYLKKVMTALVERIKFPC